MGGSAHGTLCADYRTVGLPICVATVLLSGLTAKTYATPVTVNAPYLVRADRAANDYGFSSGDFIVFGNIDVNPTSGTIGTATTTNLSTGATVTKTIPFVGSTALPRQYSRRIAYSPDLTGPWTLTYTNGSDSTSVVTASLVGIPPAPFATNVTVSGPALTPTFTWSYPSTVNGIIFGIFDMSKLNAARTGPDYIWDPGLRGTANSYTIPTGVLNSTDRYVVDLYGFVERNPALPLSDPNTKAWSESLFGLNPVASPLPVHVPTLSGGSYIYDFSVVAGTEYFVDPQVATGYIYKIGNGNPNFASVSLPTSIGDNLFDISELGEDGIWELVEHNIAGGSTFDFGPDGVDEFEITGIEADAMLDPTDTEAFVTGLTFVAGGEFTGTQTPLVSDMSVPEPASSALLFGAVAALGLARRTGRRPPSEHRELVVSCIRLSHNGGFNLSLALRASLTER